MFEIEKQYSILNKHDRIRTEQWTKKLCQVKINLIKNRLQLIFNGKKIEIYMLDNY